jgi:hypothetical protein
MDNLIIKYLINKTTNEVLPECISLLRYDFVCHCTVSKYIYNPIKNPFANKLSIYKLYKDILDKKIFLMSQDREKLLAILEQYQRIKFAMYKFQNAFRYKYMYSKFDYEYDMEMNELSRLPQRKLVNIVENNTIYKFSLCDIIKIIFTSLNNVEEFVHYPYQPKNPFTNTPLSYSNMVNFYFSLLNSGIKTPQQVVDYYNMNFDMATYKSRYRIFVIEQYIKGEFMHRNDKEIYDEIYDMYKTSRENLDITTLTVKPYSQVNKHYIKHMKEKFSKALQYYIMTTVLDDQHAHNIYLHKFIKEFKKVNFENPGINRFYRFEKQRIEKERNSLFNVNRINSSHPIQLFGTCQNIINQNNLTNDSCDNSVNEPFGPNPFE